MAPDTVLRKLAVYETHSRYYLVGRSKSRQEWRVLKINRLEPRELDIFVDPVTYTEQQLAALMSQLHSGNSRHGGVRLVFLADALLGCFRFLGGYYMLFALKKRLQGSVCGEKIYAVGETATLPLVQPQVQSKHMPLHVLELEKRYSKLLAGVGLTQDFFWSYSYPTWRTLQANMTSAPQGSAFDSMFVWNDFLTKPLRQATGSDMWTMPLVHGFWQQRTLAMLGRMLTLSVIARRSRHFAGTRYRKRGIHLQGHVANDVETEQVAFMGFDWRSGYPIVSSAVQVRGSIPIYWTQNSLQRRLKPEIQLQRHDPLYKATRLHFQDLVTRYGMPLVVLNLVKSAEKHARETLLRKEYERAIQYLNKQGVDGERVQYIPFDFHFHSKQRGAQVLAEITPTVQTALAQTGIFACPPALPSPDAHRLAAATWVPPVELQAGVLRANCIDCLDRTNVAQFTYGHAALGRQLHALGLKDEPGLDLHASVVGHLMHMYEAMGHVLARQYGGSQAHTTVFEKERGDWELFSRIKDKLTSFRRFMANSYTDADKQDAINLFLGNFVPSRSSAPLWDLDSDAHLHSGPSSRAEAGRPAGPVGQGEALGHDRSALQSMDSLAAPQDAAADQAGHNGPAPAPEPEPVPEGRLPGQEAAEGLPQASPAIARFRAPVHPSDRPKLESFDQKIGKQPNAVQEVQLYEAPSERVPYLPHWLSSPLGLRLPRRASHTSLVAQQQAAAAPSQAPPPRARSVSAPEGAATSGTAGMPRALSAGASEVAAEQGRLLVLDAAAERPRRPPVSCYEEADDRPAQGEGTVVDCMQAQAERAAAGILATSRSVSPQRRPLVSSDFKRSESCTVAPAAPPQPRQAPRRRVTFPAPHAGPQPALRPSSAGATPGASSGVMRQGLALQRQGSQQQAAALGLSPETASLWGDSQNSSALWWEGDERQLATYSRFLVGVADQLGEQATGAKRAQYARLASPQLHVALEGCTQGTPAAWRRQQGLHTAHSLASQALTDLAGAVY